MKQVFRKGIKKIILQALILMLILFSPLQCYALEMTSGESLFNKNCSSCHLNGGNIIRRGKTLKLSALKSRGLDNPEAIAKIASDGIGIMSGYKEVLGNGGDELVAVWIWEQAQNAWVQE